MRWVPIAALCAHACSLKVPPGTVQPDGDFPCAESEECPAPPNGCLLSQCYDGGCVYIPSPAGILPPNEQKEGDCKALYCDGQGQPTEREAPFDGPPDDDNACTEEVCEGDKALRKHVAAGATCASGVCNGRGVCGECFPHEERCEGDAVVECSEAGKWSEPSACPAAQPSCIDARCVGPTSLAAGGAHACAVFTGGTVRCWGSNVQGELGDGGVDAAGSLEDLGIESVVRFAFGPRHACAADQGGTLRCWGANDFGQLGDGTFVSNDAPVEVALRGVVDVVVGDDHTCAQSAAGAVWCWGRNDRGQCGSGKPSKPVPREPTEQDGGGANQKPVTIPGLGDAALVLAVRHTTCVRRKDGSHPCWGMPYYSGADEPTGKELAARKKITIPAPGAPVLADAADLACGADHCCASKTDGSVVCWGAGDLDRLGAAGPDRAAPGAVPGVSDVARITAGRDFTCTLGRDGAVHCWGANHSGQLGRGGSDKSGGPAPIALSGAARGLVSGDEFACVLGQGSAIACWGHNGLGQLGREQPAFGATPEAVVW
jgi:alpha-tubulin suppressor-like RCC1 family protein